MVMFTRRFISLGAGVILLGLSVGCKGATNTDPSQIAPTQVVEEKTGTLQPGGTSSQNFTVTYAYGSGVLESLKTLTSVPTGAALTTTVGLGLGVVNGFDGSCVLQPGLYTQSTFVGDLAHNSDNVVPGFFVSGYQYCAQIYDNGSLTVPVNYTIELTHY